MRKEYMKLFHITGVNPSNKHEYHYVLAVCKEKAINIYQENYPGVAITKIKILRPNPKNLDKIIEAIQMGGFQLQEEKEITKNDSERTN